MPKRTLQGVVVSNKQNKTVVVRVDRRFTHPIYQKTVRRSKKYHAHDEANEYGMGDRVWIEETRPISKLKRWMVTGGVKDTGQGAPRSSNRDPGSNLPRNEHETGRLDRREVNHKPLSSSEIKDFGAAFDQLVAQILVQLAFSPPRVPELAGEQLSFILSRMEASTIHDRIGKLLLKLDSGDELAISKALTTLSIVLPRLDLDRCLLDDELRESLYGIPDRLMAALSENLETTSAAKKAAFALVAAMYPEHYSGTRVAANEKTARADLETIFQQNNVTSFFTVNARAATDTANVEARLWDGVPFKLDGVKPSLVGSSLFGDRGDLDICQMKGAKKIKVEKIKRSSLADGQFGALIATLKPDPASAVHNKVILYFGNDQNVYRREVFDLKTLFPNYTPT